MYLLLLFIKIIIIIIIIIVTNPRKYVISNQDTATLAVKAAGFGLTLSSTSTPDFSSLFFHICSITIVVVLLYYYPIFVSYLITNLGTAPLVVAAAGFALTLALLCLLRTVYNNLLIESSLIAQQP